MQRAQAGDQQAYHDLLTALVPVVRRFVQHRSGRAPWADDAVQDVLWSLHRARHTWNPARPFSPWFYAVMRHRLIDTARRATRVSRRETADELVLAQTAADLPEPGEDADRAARVRAAVEALPARQRDVVRMLKLEERSVREVAGRLGMSESNVKVTAHRAYRVLRERLGGWWHGA